MALLSDGLRDPFNSILDGDTLLNRTSKRAVYLLMPPGYRDFIFYLPSTDLRHSFGVAILHCWCV